VAIASSLGLGHVRVPILAPFTLAMNGNAITVSPALHAEIAAAADGDLADPQATARALARVIAARKAAALEPLTFGMTFPFSSHNYDLRLWLAAGGIDPDEDVRLVVLPPPYMVESLANAHVDAFCVGAPWSSVAVDLGIGHILHCACDLVPRATEKVLAVRARWAQDNADVLARLLRALDRAAAFVADAAHRDEVAALLAAPNRVGVEAPLIAAVLEGRLSVARDEPARASKDFLVIGREQAARPDPAHAAWLYAQMVRWRQAPASADLLSCAKMVFRPDLFDAALGSAAERATGGPADRIGAFAGPSFDPDDIASYLAALSAKPKESNR
jgi:two-component system, oxyanion-binding sensor